MRLLLMLSVSLGLLSAKNVDIALFKTLPMFTAPGVEVLQAYDHGSIYQVEFSSPTQRGTKVFQGFVTKDKKSFIMGEAYDIQTKEKLSIPLDAASIKANADIIYGTGKTPLVVITDPECRYCQVFQTKWERLKATHTLYVYLYPLSHHEEATQMSAYVMSQNTHEQKALALMDIARKSKAYTAYTPSVQEQTQLNAKFEYNMRLADRLQVRGTPAVFDFKGNFINWSELVK